MNATTHTENTALAPFQGASAGALLMNDAAMERIDKLAQHMSTGKVTVPQHLRASPGDCFAICLQSLQWGMNPFAVAQKTHLVNGVLGYEAQLVAAVINNSGIVRDRFNFEWYGPWQKVIGKFTIKKGDKGEYRVPGWAMADEEGLGVKVWATLRGESQPRVLDLLLAQARVRNSTLWADDPKQQLAYLAQKRWARLYAPDVILGVYSPDEVEAPEVKFMGAAEVVEPAPEPKAYDAQLFDKNFPQWAEVIRTGRKTPDALIAFAETRGTPYTDEQKDRLMKVKVDQAAQPTDVEPKKPAPAAAAAMTFAQIAGQINAAQKHADLEALAEHIGALPDAQQRQELAVLAEQRASELPAFD